MTFAVLGVAAGWSMVEIVLSGSVEALAIFGAIWAVAVILAAAAQRGGRVAWERYATVLLGGVFFANRLVFFGVDVLALTAFLGLLLFLTVVQRFNRVFGEVYRSIQGDTPLLGEVDHALFQGVVRALGAIGLALALTLVVANAITLALAPFTSSLSALILTLLFILIVSRLVRGPTAARESSE